MADESRKLSRNETHDLGMIIKDRAKVLKAHVASMGASRLADFEQQLAAIYSFDQDEVWKAATEEATAIVLHAQERIAKRCEELGIPKTFAPRLGIHWEGRGENALADRRAELRRVAKTTVEAMEREALLKIEQQSLDLRTQVVAMGLLSPDAKLFLESLAPVEDAMRSLTFEDVERRLEQQRADRRRLMNRYD
jgi:hypothetical protein